MTGLLSGTSSDMQRGSASRFALRSLFASVRNVPERSPRHAPGFPAFTALRSAGGGGRGCGGYVSRLLFRGKAAKSAPLLGEWETWLLRQLIPVTNYPRHTCANDCSCYTCNCCFRAGWNSPLAVNRAVPRGYRGAGKVPAVEPMSPRPGCALVRMPAELVRFQYQRLESG